MVTYSCCSAAKCLETNTEKLTVLPTDYLPLSDDDDGCWCWGWHTLRTPLVTFFYTRQSSGFLFPFRGYAYESARNLISYYFDYYQTICYYFYCYRLLVIIIIL